ncbi:MAG: hypothetical protein US22_C0001G0006 [candidate division TM6 bacterium GW2011_GWF2_36_6]|nr:MAG: hypothetical protein US22_C0001G0006 [candidate division TM6 bacterium GW2011_GWF2_36_6]
MKVCIFVLAVANFFGNAMSLNAMSNLPQLSGERSNKPLRRTTTNPQDSQNMRVFVNKIRSNRARNVDCAAIYKSTPILPIGLYNGFQKCRNSAVCFSHNDASVSSSQKSDNDNGCVYVCDVPFRNYFVKNAQVWFSHKIDLARLSIEHDFMSSCCDFIVQNIGELALGRNIIIGWSIKPEDKTNWLYCNFINYFYELFKHESVQEFLKVFYDEVRVQADAPDCITQAFIKNNNITHVVTCGNVVDSDFEQRFKVPLERGMLLQIPFFDSSLNK